MYKLIADLILYIHALFVVFVVIGFVLIIVGLFCRWAWVRRFWFRLVHLASIAVVTVQTLCGRYCPLTIWENRLRRAAGEATYEGSFIQAWVERIIYYDISLKVFAFIYAGFLSLVVLTWIVGPPVPPWRSKASKQRDLRK